MLNHLAAQVANCKTGSWAQQWKCGWNAGWNASTSRASNAGFGFGHNIAPILIVAVFLWLAFRFAKSRRGAPAKAAARR